MKSSLSAKLDEGTQSVDDLFTELAENEQVTQEKLQQEFSVRVVLPEPLTRAEFRLMLGNYWIALDSIPMTENLAPGGVPARSVSKFEVFRALGKVETMDDGKKRMPIQFDDSKSGWITIVSRGVANCKPLPRQYVIKSATVLTANCELTALKVVRRVLADEKVEALTVPKIWNQLLRLKVRCLEGGAEGWFTLADMKKNIISVSELEI